MNSIVLVLDRDRSSRRATISALRYGGCETETARDLREAVRLLRRHRFTALLVDPGDGPEGERDIEELRALTTTPIIVISSVDDRVHKVGALDAGADDYVTRPFDPEELLARVRAVERRGVRLEDDQPIFTPAFTIYLRDRRLVRVDGREAVLSPIEWRLIEVLAQHADHLVTREELLTSVWGPESVDKTQYLRVHMASIRQKVEPDPPRPRYFLTIPGLGLRFDSHGGTAEGGAQRLTPTG